MMRDMMHVAPITIVQLEEFIGSLSIRLAGDTRFLILSMIAAHAPQNQGNKIVISSHHSWFWPGIVPDSRSRESRV